MLEMVVPDRLIEDMAVIGLSIEGLVDDCCRRYRVVAFRPTRIDELS